jgi:hypothetical protein
MGIGGSTPPDNKDDTAVVLTLAQQTTKSCESVTK